MEDGSHIAKMLRMFCYTLGLSRIMQETATVNHECDMLMHGQPVTQRLSEVGQNTRFPMLYHCIPM